MIEKTILDHLSAVLDAPCGMEVPPDPPPRFVVLEKTGEHALVYSLAVGDTVGLK